MRASIASVRRGPCLLRSRGFSESFREKLRTGPSLDDFVAGGVSAEPGQNVVRRERGVKVPWKPDERLPEWLKVPVPAGKNFTRIKNSVKSHGLATVCEEAKCPNIGECWGGKEGTATATIMVLGDTCTRGCRFCAVKTSSKPPPPDPNEPSYVASTVGKWGVDYVVMTSVDRDDLPDGGALHFAECVRQLKEKASHVTLECLTGDFAGKLQDITTVVMSGMDVFAHNVETVDRLQSVVRDYRANYRQSLMVLRTAKELRPDLPTKSSIMLGCGETDEEIKQTFRDLRAIGVDIVTLGQYLRPTKHHMKVHRYVTPEEFDAWRVVGEEMGFAYVASGPLVRSSYRAGEFFIKAMLSKKTPVHN